RADTRGDRSGNADQGHLRSLSRTTGNGRCAVPTRPSGGGLGHSWTGVAGGGPVERAGHTLSDSRRPVARAEDRRTGPRGCPDTRGRHGHDHITRTVPAEPSTVSTCPVAICSVAPGTPTTAGIPYSRATIDPCDIAPPISITRPPAVKKRGVQPGSVDGATSISPGLSVAPTGSRITRAEAVTCPAEAGVPRRTLSG